MKRLAIFLVSLLALGFAVAGCGDDEKDEAKDSAPAADTASSEADTGTSDSGNGSSGGAKVDASDPRVKQAIENCKKQADVNTQLSADAKKKIGEVCEKGLTGNADAAVKASKEACKVIAEDTAPAGAARDQAVTACDQIKATP